MKRKSHSICRRSALDRKFPRCCVYAIRLSAEAQSYPGFREANPRYLPGQPCVYIGMTSLTPEQRLQNHLTGRGFPAEIVRRYGIELCPEMLPRISTKPRSKAMKLEREIACRLRSRGMGVWQH